MPSYHTAASSLDPTAPSPATSASLTPFPGASHAQQPHLQLPALPRQHDQSPHHGLQLQVVRLDHSPSGFASSSAASPYPTVRDSEASYGGDQPVRHLSQLMLSTTESQSVPNLQARAFQLSYTLLQHMVSLQGHQQQQHQLQGKGQPSALSPMEAAASVLEGLVVADCGRWVQDPRHPSRDVCMIMERRGGPGGDAAAAAPGEAGARAEAEGQGVAQSVVLLGLMVGGGSALGLYLACPLRLPGTLLEGVRGSCAELLRTVGLMPHGPCNNPCCSLIGHHSVAAAALFPALSSLPAATGHTAPPPPLPAPQHLAQLLHHKLTSPTEPVALEWATLCAGMPSSYALLPRPAPALPNPHPLFHSASSIFASPHRRYTTHIVVPRTEPGGDRGPVAGGGRGVVVGGR